MIDISKTVSSLEKDYIRKLLKQGKRIDGRGMFEFREVKVNAGFLPKAEGSADVHIGDSRVMCGIKYDVGRPYSDNPDKGVCTVMSEFIPIASPMFEPGRPDEVAIQLARVVDRGIRHTNCLDYKELCIKVGEFVYIIFVDIYMMDHFGNLTDTSAIAAIAALLNVNLPRAKINADGQPEWDGTYKPLSIAEVPLSISFGKIDDVIFVDPILPEEMVLDGSIAFAVDEKKQVTSIQKYGSCTWSIEEIMETSAKAVEIADELRKKLDLRQYTPKPK
ncbi:MAG: exosome complex protein Rrp42 [Promethearchaeota archaeon]